jgi:cell division protein FtsI (penicillin-binding protein 3)
MMKAFRTMWPRRVRRPASSRAAADWRATLKQRAAMGAAALMLWTVAIEARLIYLQVVQRSDLVERAERQQLRTRPLSPKRGDILDRRGHILATSVEADTIYAVPSAIGDERDAVEKLCTALASCRPAERQELVERLSTQRHFAYVRRQVTPEEARRVAALNLEGVEFLKENRRFYPNKELAAHLLGFVGLDNKGLSGIESAYDSQIRGQEGRILVHADAKRHAFSRVERPPTVGATIELTVDEYLQHVAERELRAGILANRAAGGSAIVMDPHTGEILAMANLPTFNPNVYRDFSETDRRNRAVQDLYEPGSTFKVVTASAALEEKVLPTTAMIDVSAGQIRIGSRVIHDVHTYGPLSFTDVIVKSSNVGAIKIGFRLGTDRLSEYVNRFGFGRQVAPDFPSENPGIVWERTKWTDDALASVSMGYQVGVTPLQMAAAVSSVANGGEYVEPRVLRAIYRGDRRYEVKPKVLRRTIGQETAAELTAIMEQVVERGTGTLAKIAGYSIAGKTGTANKLVNGHYSNHTYASFVGFVPSQKPVVTILVVLDSPTAASHFGGPVSAPIFRKIAEATLRYLAVPPSIDPVPPVLVARAHEEPATLVSSPAPAPLAAAPPLVNFVVGESQPGTVPDVRGMSARAALHRLASVGLSAGLSGDGFVVNQEPAPGAPIEEGIRCRLTLQRTALATPFGLETR